MSPAYVSDPVIFPSTAVDLAICLINDHVIIIIIIL